MSFECHVCVICLCEGVTAAHEAAASNKGAAVVALHAEGANLNLADANGNTPLHVAAQKAEPAVVATISELKGVEVNAKNNEGNTPLVLSATVNNVGASQALINGAPISVGVLSPCSAGASTLIRNNNMESAAMVANKVGAGGVAVLITTHNLKNAGQRPRCLCSHPRALLL